MRLGFLSDVHGNVVALEEVLPRLLALSPDAVHFLGDAVGYLPEEGPVLERLAAEGIECQKGNHEAMLLEEAPIPAEAVDAYRLGDARGRLGDGELRTLAGWPEQRELELGGRRILLVHGAPDDPLHGYVYPDSDLAPYASLPYDLIVTANTHRPFAVQLAGPLLGNVGSVGLPRDVGNLASFAVYDTSSGEFGVHRVPFDADRVRARAGGRLHPSVDALLSREEPQPFGELLP
jgi:predicted phosphodiesterase